MKIIHFEKNLASAYLLWIQLKYGSDDIVVVTSHFPKNYIQTPYNLKDLTEFDPYEDLRQMNEFLTLFTERSFEHVTLSEDHFNQKFGGFPALETVGYANTLTPGPVDIGLYFPDTIEMVDDNSVRLRKIYSNLSKIPVEFPLLSLGLIHASVSLPENILEALGDDTIEIRRNMFNGTNENEIIALETSFRGGSHPGYGRMPPRNERDEYDNLDNRIFVDSDSNFGTRIFEYPLSTLLPQLNYLSEE